jgi:hypothetical protein
VQWTIAIPFWKRNAQWASYSIRFLQINCLVSKIACL